jgi:opacity protein-like surface antigen
MKRLLAIVAVLLAQGSVVAHAQASPSDVSISSFNPANSVAPASTVEGAGVKVGEGTVLRPVLGVETGYVSNVFYEDNNEKGSGVLRLLAQIGVASLGQARLHPSAMADSDQPQENLGALQYRADLRLAYDLMLSGTEVVKDTGGLSVGATLKGMVNPMGRVAFGFNDDFNRLIRAANFETDSNTNRDINNLELQLLWKPSDSAISAFLYYSNTFDVFERSEQNFADRMTNRVGLHPQWRFLPQTQAYLDLSIGNVTALNSDSEKSSSYPLQTRAGLATLLSARTTLNIDGGYTNGFYSHGPSFSAPMIGAQLGYRYTETGRVTLGYQLLYEDSINANYYRDHVIRASIEHMIAPLIFVASPEVHFRRYSGINTAVPDVMGPDSRTDTIFAVTAGLNYNFRNWIAVTLNYRFSTVQTDYRYMSGGGTVDDPSFVRHEILGGVRAAL